MAQVSNKKYDFDLLASLTENGWKIFTTSTVAANWLNVFAPVCVCVCVCESFEIASRIVGVLSTFYTRSHVGVYVCGSKAP